MPLKAGFLYEFGPYRLDAQQRLLWNGDELVPLTLKALETLLALVENPGRLVGKDELMRRLWPDTFVEENNLTFNISVLRKALTDGQSGFAYIETIPRRGYRFIAPVVEIEPTAPAGVNGDKTAGIPSGTVSPPVGASNGTALQEAAADCAPVFGADGDASSQGYREEARLQTAPPESQLKTYKRAWLAVAAAIGAAAVLAGCVWLLVRPLPPPTVHSPKPLTNDGLTKGQLATDGQRLYFTEWVTGNLVLKQVPLKGGDTTEVPGAGRGLQISDLSPDESLLLLSNADSPDAPIWVLPLPGGSPRRLGNLLGHDASWSRDGRKIAYCSGHGLYVANQDGSDPHQVALVTGDACWPHWSPDGTLLRFTEAGPRAVAGSWSKLWEVSPSGTHLHLLLPGSSNPPRDSHGSWTPDGRYFVFEWDNDDSGGIWAIREKGAGMHRGSREPMPLTDLARLFYNPVVSPDGRRILFLGRTEQGHLEHFSTPEKEFVPFLNGISAEQVTYSRDGQSTAYVKYPEGTLWRMKPDGTELLQLTYSPMKVKGLAWSPDGKQIAFSGATAANPYKNYLVAAKGNEDPRELQPRHNEMEGIPSWSEDGKKIAFGDVPEKFGQGGKGNVIHILDLLTHKPETLPHSEGFWSPRWSPDGRYLAALKDDDPDPNRQPLWLYDWKLETWLDLHVDYVKDLLWSRDGKYIYYDGEPGHSGIFRVRVPNGKPEPVANTDGIMRAEGYWFGLTPEDSPMILQEAGSEEIYSVDVDWR